MKDEFIWEEKYRPPTVADCILPPHLKNIFLDMVKQGDVPNLLLVGPSGHGKTTVAYAMLEELDCDYLFIQASIEGNIDTLRTKITQFASSVSFKGKRKYVVLDEADHVTYATQPALRNLTHEFSQNCGFILTANYQNKIIAPLQSRCSVVDFTFRKEDAPKIAAEFYKRVCEILTLENVDFDKKAIIPFINKYFPDLRRILNELQFKAASGRIDANSLIDFKNVSTKELIEFMKAKDYTKTRKWIGENMNNDPQPLFRDFYDQASAHFKPATIPSIIMILGEYQHKSSMVIDQEINMAACLAAIMAEAIWN